ncbi:hypothetical protein LIER_15678 [Lithospermum erythrorhizon]|uniref:Uncharacterized protein n=1 Tax=Lithospermum erythrorhizon TaxID=34254 RepID=A0AAV3Q6B8_LITER
MSTSNVQCQRPQGRDAAKRSKDKSSKASKIEGVERVVECHDDYMTFRKKELERYEAMEAVGSMSLNDTKQWRQLSYVPKHEILYEA